MRASILLMLSMCYCGLVMFGVSVSKHFFQEKVINTSWDGSSVAPPCFAVGLMGREFCSSGFCFLFALYQEIVMVRIIAAMPLIVMKISIVVVMVICLSWWS